MPSPDGKRRRQAGSNEDNLSDSSMNERKSAKSAGTKQNDAADIEKKKAQKREASRISAMKSRKLRAITIEHLQETIAKQYKDNNEVRKSNEELEAQLAATVSENESLKNRLSTSKTRSLASGLNVATSAAATTGAPIAGTVENPDMHAPSTIYTTSSAQTPVNFLNVGRQAQQAAPIFLQGNSGNIINAGVEFTNSFLGQAQFLFPQQSSAFATQTGQVFQNDPTATQAGQVFQNNPIGQHGQSVQIPGSATHADNGATNQAILFALAQHFANNPPPSSDR